MDYNYSNSYYNRGYDQGKSESTVNRTLIGSGGAGSYSATSISNYQNLTVENFAYIPTTVYCDDNHWGNPDTFSDGIANKTSNVSISYEPSTGIVTVSNISTGFNIGESGGGGGIKSGNLYCYH